MSPQAQRTPGRVHESARRVDEHPPHKANHEEVVRQPGRVTQSAHRLDEPPPLEKKADPAPTRRWYQRPWRSSFVLLLATLVLSVLWQWSTTLKQLWINGTVILAAPLTLLSVLLLVALSMALIRERRAATRITRLARQRAAAHKAIQTNDLSALKTALQPTLNALQTAHPALIADFHRAVRTETRAVDYANRFENLVLRPLDTQANQKINQATLTVGTLIAAVPHPALDAVVVIWRAWLLIRDLGQVYGLNPTGLSALRLFRYALGSAFLAAGSHAAGDVMLDEVGRGVLASAGKKVSESAISATRMRRLGKMTQQIIRPLEHTPDQQPAT